MITSHASNSDEAFANLSLQDSLLENSEFYDCSFNGCKFTGAILQNCRLVDCNFADCDLSLLQVPGTSFKGVSFKDCKLVGIDWTRARWGRTALNEPFSFERCALNHCTFIGLELPSLRLVDCLCNDVDFREAVLTEADFSGTDLSASLFLRTDLSRSDLSRARNYRINPDENTLHGAKFSLPEAMALLYSLDIELLDRLDSD